MVEQSVDVRAETLGFDGRCAGEDSDGGFGGDELPLSERGKLADRYAVSRYDERLPPVERAHDLATLIAQLSLCDLPCHLDHCSTCATLAKADAAVGQVGEAARRVSTATRAASADIAWAAIAGMRNRIYQQYGSLDVAILRETVARDLSVLLKRLDAMLR